MAFSARTLPAALNGDPGDFVTSVTVLNRQGATYTVGTPSVTVTELDDSGMVLRASGTTVPTDADAGYATGAIFRKTNGGAGTTIYVNEGSNTSASFRALDTAGGFSVPISATDSTSTTGQSFKITSSALTTGNVIDAVANTANFTTGGAVIKADMVAAVAGNAIVAVTTGVYTGTGLLTLTAASATTGTLASISGAGLTTGVALAVTGTSSKLVAFGLGTTNPAFQVDASTASSATGVKVTSAAAAAGVAVAVISSGTNENLTIDAKGSGTVTINGTGTGNIVLGAAATGVSASVTGLLTSRSGTAVPATASAVAAVTMYSTGIAIYVTSDTPTHTAPKGSITINTGGSSTSTRMYVNTDGATTWTSFTTAA